MREVIFMSYKRIVFNKPNTAELLEYEIDLPKENEVQIKLVVSTISSGTERANLIGDPNTAPDKASGPMFPKTLGYSSSGIVTAVGEGAEEFKIGDRVAMSWTIHLKQTFKSAALELEKTYNYFETLSDNANSASVLKILAEQLNSFLDKSATIVNRIFTLTNGKTMLLTDYSSAGKLWSEESKMAVRMLTD